MTRPAAAAAGLWGHLATRSACQIGSVAPAGLSPRDKLANRSTPPSKKSRYFAPLTAGMALALRAAAGCVRTSPPRASRGRRPFGLSA